MTNNNRRHRRAGYHYHTDSRYHERPDNYVRQALLRVTQAASPNLNLNPQSPESVVSESMALGGGPGKSVNRDSHSESSGLEPGPARPLGSLIARAWEIRKLSWAGPGRSSGPGPGSSKRRAAACKARGAGRMGRARRAGAPRPGCRGRPRPRGRLPRARVLQRRGAESESRRHEASKTEFRRGASIPNVAPPSPSTPAGGSPAYDGPARPLDPAL